MHILPRILSPHPPQTYWNRVHTVMAPLKNSSYAFQKNLTSFKSTNPRPLRPLVDPPQHLLLYPPVLPSPPRSIHQSSKSGSASSSGAFSSRYTLSTHIIPGAFPRTTPYVPPFYDPSFSNQEIRSDDRAAKDERKKKLGVVARKLLALKELFSYGEREDEDVVLPTDGSENRILWNAVNRYVRKDLDDDSKLANNTTRLTLFITHANGFPKEVCFIALCPKFEAFYSSYLYSFIFLRCVEEIWEPFLALLIETLISSRSSLVVDEIWCFEAVNHGDACLINEGKLGSLCMSCLSFRS